MSKKSKTHRRQNFLVSVRFALLLSIQRMSFSLLLFSWFILFQKRIRRLTKEKNFIIVDYTTNQPLNLVRKEKIVKAVFDDSKPIFQQISDMIANEIVENKLSEGDQIPSTTEISKFYQVNRATVQKGLSALVDAGYVYKQRGVGMFVSEGAKQKLLEKRKEDFYNEYLKPMMEEAKRIEIKKEELLQVIKEDYKDD